MGSAIDAGEAAEPESLTPVDPLIDCGKPPANSGTGGVAVGATPDVIPESRPGPIPGLPDSVCLSYPAPVRDS